MVERSIRAYQAAPATPRVKRRKHEVAKRARAAQREPSELEGEEVEEKETQDEGGHDDPDEREDEDRSIQGPSTVECGGDAERDPDDELDDRGSKREQRRFWEPVGDQLAYGRVVLVRAAEIAAQHVAQVLPVLDEQRIVQPEFLPNPLDHRVARVDPSVGLRRVDRRDLRRRECERDDRPEDDDSPSDTPQRVARHQRMPPTRTRVRRSRVGSRASRSPSPRSPKPSIAKTTAPPGKATSQGDVTR